MTISASGILLFLLALLLGLNLPDLDQQLPFLTHRSIITHGLLIPLGLAWAVNKEKVVSTRLLSMGFNIAIVIHLVFDLFPRAWTGFALIHILFWGRSSALFSWLWISISSIVCLYMTFILLRILADTLLISGSLLFGLIFYASRETIFLAPLVALLIAICLTLFLPADSRQLWHSLLTYKPTNKN